MNTRHRRLLAPLAILALLLAACGGSTPPAAEQTTPSTGSGQSAAAAQAAAPTNAPAAAEPTAAPEPTTAAEPAQSGGGQKIRVWIVDWGETTGKFTELLTAGAKSLGLELELVQNVEYDKVLAAIQGGDPPELIVPGGADNICASPIKDSWCRCTRASLTTEPSASGCCAAPAGLARL